MPGLLPVAERTRALFGKDEADAPAARVKRSPQLSLDLAEELGRGEEEGGWCQKSAPRLDSLGSRPPSNDSVRGRPG